ncbi:MAG TPA: hypothetical protein VLG76_01240 [Rhabdochlamydiaceae bacterium]|nr:hypothetical protein [Rhabdochlamydiaceae bacterium]
MTLAVTLSKGQEIELLALITCLKKSLENPEKNIRDIVLKTGIAPSLFKRYNEALHNYVYLRNNTSLTHTQASAKQKVNSLYLDKLISFLKEKKNAALLKAVEETTQRNL